MKLAEEIRPFTITAVQHNEIKRLIRLASPEIKSSHCAEAVARGFQFGTNAALIAEFKDTGFVERVPSRELFEEFLAARGHDTDHFQVSLFTDAVRLATGSKWRPLPSDDTIFSVRNCWVCLDSFGSEGSHNRICQACRYRNGRVIGINHKQAVHKSICKQAFLNGKSVSDRRDLIARPGWHDFLHSSALNEEIAEILAHRLRAQGGDFSRMPNGIKALFLTNSYYDIMDELEVPRKKAKQWWSEGRVRGVSDEVEYLIDG